MVIVQKKSTICIHTIKKMEKHEKFKGYVSVICGIEFLEIYFYRGNRREQTRTIYDKFTR